MEFRYYDPEKVIPELVKTGVSYDYFVCSGCVFAKVLPEDCIHDRSDLRENSVQSDMFCEHCIITIEDDGEPFHLHLDDTLEGRLAELKEIAEMAIRRDR